MGFLNTLFPWGWSCLVHFLVVEMRALYLFYGSVKSFTAKVAISAEMQRQLGGNAGKTDWSKLCVHDWEKNDLLQCVTQGVENALWMLWIPDDHEVGTGCYRKEQPGLCYVGVLHLSALAICGLFLLTCLMLLFCSDATDWRAGNYLYFTWQLEHRKRYKLGASLLFTYTAVFITFVIVASCELIDTQHLFLPPDQLLELSALDMFGILTGAYAFMGTTDPPFNWQESKLMEFSFRGRSWLNLISGSNDAFGERLEHAILKARLDQPKELEKLLGQEFDGPLTRQILSGGRAAMGEDERRLLMALGALPTPSELEAKPESPSRSFWKCGTSMPPPENNKNTGFTQMEPLLAPE